MMSATDQPAAPESDATARSRGWTTGPLGTCLRCLFLVAVVAGLGRYVWLHWDAVCAIRPQGHWGHLIIGMAIAAAATMLQVALLRYFLRHNGLSLSFTNAWEVYILPQLGKYVPGKTAAVAASSYMLTRRGLSLPHALAAISIFTGVGLLTGTAFGLMVLPSALGYFEAGARLAMLSVAAVGLVLVCTPVAWKCMNRVLKWCRRPAVDRYPGAGVMFLLLCGSLCRWVLYALAYVEIARVLRPLDLAAGSLLVAAITLSYLAGLVAVFAPAGIGVREGVLIALLNSATGPGFATQFAALSRAVMVAMDVLMVSTCKLMRWRQAPGGTRACGHDSGGRQPGDAGVYEYQHGFSHDRATMFDSSRRQVKADKTIVVLTRWAETSGRSLADMDLLDVGCSTGFMTRAYAAHVGTATGIDIDAEAIAFANADNETANASFQVQDSMAIGLKSGSFDVVTCTHVYEHVPDAARLLREIHRLLKPGGVCYFAAGNRLIFMEHHYRLPLLSAVPKPVAHLYLRLLGRGSRYYETHRTYWGLKRLVRAFEVTDYTLAAIRDPEAFRVTDIIPPGSLKQRLILAVFPWLYWLSPSYVWLLRKPDS